MTQTFILCLFLFTASFPRTHNPGRRRGSLNKDCSSLLRHITGNSQASEGCGPCFFAVCTILSPRQGFLLKPFSWSRRVSWFYCGHISRCWELSYCQWTSGTWLPNNGSVHCSAAENGSCPPRVEGQYDCDCHCEPLPGVFCNCHGGSLCLL